MSKRKSLSPKPELVRRTEAVEATVRHFAGRDFRLGQFDCASVAAFLLKRFGWKIPKFAGYRTEAQAKAVLAGLGAQTLADVIDAIGLPRRDGYASAREGDLLFIPSATGTLGIGALCIALSGGGMKGFLEDHAELVTLRTEAVTVCWNILK